MSEDRRLSAADQGTVDRAREVFEDVLGTDYSTLDTVDFLEAISDLRSQVALLLQVVDRLTPTRSERLAAQADREFLNLSRAASRQIFATQGSLRRLEKFKRALDAMLYPDEEASR